MQPLKRLGMLDDHVAENLGLAAERPHTLVDKVDEIDVDISHPDTVAELLAAPLAQIVSFIAADQHLF